jgi:hypothetical protein
MRHLTRSILLPLLAALFFNLLADSNGVLSWRDFMLERFKVDSPRNPLIQMHEFYVNGQSFILHICRLDQRIWLEHPKGRSADWVHRRHQLGPESAFESFLHLLLRYQLIDRKYFCTTPDQSAGSIFYNPKSHSPFLRPQDPIRHSLTTNTWNLKSELMSWSEIEFEEQLKRLLLRNQLLRAQSPEVFYHHFEHNGSDSFGGMYYLYVPLLEMPLSWHHMTIMSDVPGLLALHLSYASGCSESLDYFAVGMMKRIRDTYVLTIPKHFITDSQSPGCETGVLTIELDTWQEQHNPQLSVALRF